ncbi:hypothetical protein GCM10023113_25190 [Cellulomonas oligotrophica]|nr:hypothetical protein Col01nite_31250 [Cellulomonas oligotrophica]
MTSGPSRPQDPVTWLASGPSLEELQAAYPEEWGAVSQRLRRASAGGPAELRAVVAEARTPAPATPGRRRPARQLVGEEVRRQMLLHAVKRVSFQVETGVREGPVRFNTLNGRAAQRLFFLRGLERRPVSMAAYGLVWPLLTQRRFLMPLVRPKGIYCFYSSALIARLAALIGDRACVEIAAGDGTLSRFLSDRGVNVTATDDYSWDHAIDYPEHVLKQDAKAALRTYAPQVVVCSWPPPGNPFERAVFATPSVQLYVVIGTNEHGSGNWADYAAQQDFEMTHDRELSRLVLPREQDNVALVFRRRPDQAPSTDTDPGR